MNLKIKKEEVIAELLPKDGYSRRLLRVSFEDPIEENKEQEEGTISDA